VPRPVAVAITGGIGAGKTEALRAFARHGAATLSADEVVHRLYEHDEEVRAALVERWGPSVLDGEGRVDRAAVAGHVFADRAELAWLEQLLHPRVRGEQERWRETLDVPVCAVEVPLLYETGGDALYDAVVVITAGQDLRHARTRKVLHDAREERLLPDEEKVRRADFAYVNDGSLGDLDAFVERVLGELTARGG
jgi:dephospho-CoA kinase